MQQDIRTLKQKCNAVMIAGSTYDVAKFGENSAVDYSISLKF